MTKVHAAEQLLEVVPLAPTPDPFRLDELRPTPGPGGLARPATVLSSPAF